VLGAMLDPEGSRQATYLLESEGTNALGGRFRLEVRGAPPFHLAVASPRDGLGRPMNLMPALQRVDDPAEGAIEVRLAPGRVIRGRVLDESGKGVAGVQVRAEVVGDETGRDGTFRLVGLLRDAAWLRIHRPRGFVQSDPVQARTGDDEVTVVLRAGRLISGRVLGPDGEPLRDGGVHAEWDDTPTAAEDSRSADVREGSFEVEGIPADAVVRLTVSAELPENGANPQEAVLEAVRPGTSDLVVRLLAGARISGVVVDEAGKPRKEWTEVSAVPENGGPNDWEVLGKDGSFVLDGLAPGPHVLHVRGPGAEEDLATVRVVASAKDVRIVVK
jgi:hypothetical protein